MKRFFGWLKGFFFPPEGTPTWVKVLPYAVLGVLTMILLMGAAYGWEYTNSPEFCGTACHTMPPEYTAYLTSPHARVDCVDCHIGKGFIAERITRKAGDARHIFATIFHSYEFPIHARDLRPARETCEKCHFPEKFSDDSLREIKRFENNYDNTPESTYLVLKTGGGSERLGLGRGIHWHIENQVDFLAIDPGEQEIPYVRVSEDDGSVTEYVDIESDIDIESINPEDLVEMDCITCHNRITHLVLTPEDTVDQLINGGLISSSIPDIRRLAIDVYGRPYESVQMGLNGIAGLAGYYETYHPEYYAENWTDIDASITVLQAAYQSSVYPEQNSDWNSHPNNIGHKDFPGCFRCHDGQHLNDQDEAIRLECNVCHSIPVVAGPNDFVVNLEVSRGPEPESHLNPNWITMHRDVFNPSCENCHTIDNPGGTDNSSFCSNSACHGNVWEHAGFDAPRLREVLMEQLPPEPTEVPISEDTPVTFNDVIGPIFALRCSSCHGPNNPLQDLNLTDYVSVLLGGVNGPAVIPGDPENSLVVIKMKGDQPHFAQLSTEELNLVIRWIAEGATE
jgi:nitrate/TMAO reductase-like tetraheme cytochrome c subunit/mono/diheme cytochrome c family protein